MKPIEKIRLTWVRVDEGWRGARLSKVALGKYIILAASILHVGWAVLLLVDEDTSKSTPIHIINYVCGGRYRTAAVLVVAAVVAAMVPFRRKRLTNLALALM